MEAEDRDQQLVNMLMVRQRVRLDGRQLAAQPDDCSKANEASLDRDMQVVSRVIEQVQDWDAGGSDGLLGVAVKRPAYGLRRHA